MVALVMGVLNVTPDSFSDGGRWFDHEAAIRHGLDMIDEGADVVDVGGESTRPGAAPVDEGEERRRVIPVIEALAPRVRVSVDTRQASVAEAAVSAGATLLNDVSATLWPIAAAAQVGWVAMHMQGDPRTMQAAPHYHDVVAEVREFLLRRADEADTAGVPEVWIDPGIGFGKTLRHNLQLLRHLDVLVATGRPVMVGASRKSFLGTIAAGLDPGAQSLPAPVEERFEGSLASAVWAMVQGVRAVRVHDVAATVHASRLLGDNVASTTAEGPGTREGEAGA
jgi:dihydropteroate synthase